MWRQILLALVCVVALVGCSKSGDDALDARWEFGYRGNTATYLGDPSDGNPKVIVFSQGGAGWHGVPGDRSDLQLGRAWLVLVRRSCPVPDKLHKWRDCRDDNNSSDDKRKIVPHQGKIAEIISSENK